jgi:hypothetical protein
MATSPNYGWLEPDNTDLVKNGALAIRTLGNAIDTTMATMTPKSTYTAKGSIAAATGASTPANLSVGNNGETLVADSSTSTGLRYQGNYAAGKNKFLNADFKIWQRGSSFTGFSSGQFFADRFSCNFNGSGATRTVSQQTFTPATAPVAGYEGQYFLRYAQSVAGTGGGYNQLKTWIEDVRSVTPNTTYTLSFWAKAAAAKNVDVIVGQSFGSGGSGDVETTIQASQALTTSWVRYSYTFTVPSISGKTVGTGSYAFVYLGLPNNDTFTIDTWGWQLEQANTATAFQTATGTISGELGACQRYYYPLAITNIDASLTVNRTSTTTSETMIYLPVSMRSIPSIVLVAVGGVYGRLVGYDITFGVTVVNVTAVGLSACFNSQALTLGFTNAALTYAAAAASCSFDNTNVASTIAFSAEL